MSRRISTTKISSTIVPTLALLFLLSTGAEAFAYPNTGVPTNLHRRFVVQQTIRKASQGKPTRRHAGVWLSGGYNRTVKSARSRGRVFRRR